MFEIRASTKDSERVFICLEEQELVMAEAKKVNADMLLRAEDYYADTNFELNDFNSLSEDLLKMKKITSKETQKFIDEMIALTKLAKTKKIPIDVIAD